MDIRFINGLYFRDIVRIYVDPQPVSQDIETFRLMDFPTKIRVMVAKYALTYKNGLVWRWIEQLSGERVGRFCDMSKNQDIEDLGPCVNILSLSRQLHETGNLMIKVNRLHFDDENSYLSHYDDIQTFDERTQDELQFFLSHKRTSTLTGLHISIRGLSTIRAPNTAELVDLTDTKIVRYLDILSLSWYMALATKNSVEAFVKRGRDVKDFLTNEFGDLPGNWRIYPCMIIEDDEKILLKYLSEEDFQFAMECVEKGL